jgi:hypothetical protein
MTGMWCDILINVIGTIIGGLFLAAFLFFISEHILTLTNLTGEWKAMTVTEKTLYNPYKNLKLSYKFHLLQKGQEIIGSGEKIKETTADGITHEYLPEKRTFLDINGYYQRNIFSADKVFLNIVEDGLVRQSRTTFILTIKKKNILSGSFTSTAADSSGQITLTKS